MPRLHRWKGLEGARRGLGARCGLLCQCHERTGQNHRLKGPPKPPWGSLNPISADLLPTPGTSKARGEFPPDFLRWLIAPAEFTFKHVATCRGNLLEVQ